jgi:hypothetical protein
MTPLTITSTLSIEMRPGNAMLRLTICCAAKAVEGEGPNARSNDGLELVRTFRGRGNTLTSALYRVTQTTGTTMTSTNKPNLGGGTGEIKGWWEGFDWH